MSNIDSPAGGTGGLVTLPGQGELPEKMRVHALAKLIGRTSREVLASLAELGVEIKSAQSSVDRKAAEQVVAALSPELLASGDTAPADAAPAPASTADAPGGAAGPTADAPAGTSDAPVSGRTRTRSRSAAPADAEGASTATTGRTRRRTAPSDAGEPGTGPSRRTRSRAAKPAAEAVDPAGTTRDQDATPGEATDTPAASSTSAATDVPAAGGTTAADDAPAPSRGSARTGRTRRRAAGDTPLFAAADPAAAAEAPAADDAPAAVTPVFAPPTPLFQPPSRPSRARRATEEPAEPEESAAPAEETDDAEQPVPGRRRRSRARRGEDTEPEETPEASSEEQAADVDADAEADAEDGDDEESGDGSARRRRRRGRRGRGRGRGTDDTEDESDEAAAEDTGDESDDEQDDAEGSDESDEAEDGSDEGDGTSRRRRRRRRRRGSGDDAATEDDPPGTVTRIRPPREARSESEGDGVQSVRGSTRLEAKRQRRRDGRDAGRRRVPILTEAEFLARRESVDRTMVVRERGDRIEIAVLEDDVLVEHFIAGRGKDGSVGDSLVGNIYLGRVQNVLPSMEAAFVDIGRGRNAVLYAGEVDWDAAGLGGKSRRIEQALSSGDSVLVQVTKDPIGHKGARLTTQISMAGRFLVYVPSGGAAGISRKLPDVERKRLKDLLKEIVPSEAGVIIRTASEGVSQEALERDVRRLQAQWDVVKTKSEQTGPGRPKAPTLLYEEPDLLIKVVRDQFNEDFTKLIVEGDDAWDTLSNYIGHVAPELADRLHRHVGTGDVFGEMRIDEQLLKALDRKVWLPSGGTLVIDRTEAMTVVDVNTGKFTGSGGNLEETVTRNNLEAAEEIVRQLRLRDIGGIIVIDFIDMVLEANRDLVLRRLTECLARDRTRHQVAEVTSLGLVQMTRKRVGGGLLEHFSTPCEHCRGRGIIVSTEPVAEKKDDDRNARNDRDNRRSRSSGRNRRDEGGQRDGGDRHGGSNGAQSATPSSAQSGQNGSAASGVAAVAAAAESRSRQVNGHASAVEAPAAEAPQTAAVAVEEKAPVTAPVVEAPEAVSATAAPAVVPADSAAPAAAVVEAPSAPAADADEPAPRRRRGRVTRTAGAPAPAEPGSAPAAVVLTVPARTEHAEEAPAAPVVAPQPEPTVVTRPRRSRRAASRPAGPPADAAPEADPE